MTMNSIPMLLAAVEYAVASTDRYAMPTLIEARRRRWTSKCRGR